MTRRDRDARVLLAHGGGGEMTRRLVADRVLPRLGNPLLDPLTDAAVIDGGPGRVCFTTDASVVQPLEFPGGDIGRLAVCGTVNDLAVMGAEPRALSLALILEEGLELARLERIVDSIARAAEEADVAVATGDTKVIERSGASGLLISTAGIGWRREEVRLGTGRVEPGDRVIVTGRIAEHGLAVLSAREGLGIDTDLRSDVAPLAHLARAILAAGDGVKFLRDPTRGGLAGVLADIAEESGHGIEIVEERIPLSRGARHAAELLGLDPLGVANEGKLVVVAAPSVADRVIAACRSAPYGERAAEIGEVVRAEPPLVELLTSAGGRRIVLRPFGEQLPRIC